MNKEVVATALEATVRIGILIPARGLVLQHHPAVLHPDRLGGDYRGVGTPTRVI